MDKIIKYPEMNGTVHVLSSFCYHLTRVKYCSHYLPDSDESMYPTRVSVGEYTYLYTIRGMKSLVYAITNAYNKNIILMSFGAFVVFIEHI